MSSGTSKITQFIKEHKALTGALVAMFLIGITTLPSMTPTKHHSAKKNVNFDNAVDKMWPIAIDGTQMSQQHNNALLSQPGNVSQAVIIDRTRATTSGRSKTSSASKKRSAVSSLAAQRGAAHANAVSSKATHSPNLPGAVKISERQPLSLERAKAILDVDYVALKQVSVTANTVVEPQPATPAVATNLPAATTHSTRNHSQTTTASTDSNTRDLFLPGTLITAKMINGLLTTAITTSPFVAIIQKVSAPNPLHHNYIGCYITGSARLNLLTHRTDVALEALSCRNSYASLTGQAVSSDLVPGLNSEYHERLTNRLFLSFVSAGGSAYMEARRKALENTFSILNDSGETITQDVEIMYPEEYAIWEGLSAAFASTKRTLAEYEARQIPVGTFDPLQEVRFQLTKPAEVYPIYTDAN